MHNNIILKNQKPVGRGSEKIVYSHPKDQNKLIKVVNPNYITFMKKERPITYRLKRLSRYWGFSNMVTEHIASREEGIRNKHYIQSLIGFVDTDMGLGIVVGAVRNIDGSIANSLGDLIRKGLFQQRHQQALNDLLNWMIDINIVFRDPGLDNLVWNEINEHFVIIDGIGSRPLFSLRPYCRWYNLRSNRRRAKKIQSRVKKCMIENNIKIN